MLRITGTVLPNQQKTPDPKKVEGNQPDSLVELAGQKPCECQIEDVSSRFVVDNLLVKTSLNLSNLIVEVVTCFWSECISHDDSLFVVTGISTCLQI